MRLLFLTHAYQDVLRGGLAEFLHHLPVALQSFGIDSLIYTKACDKETSNLIGPEQLPNGIERYMGPFLKPGFFVSNKVLQPLIKLCQQERIDLVHAQGVYRAGFISQAIKKRLGIPYIITSHSDISQTNSKRMQRRRIKERCKKILSHADFVTHLTPMMQLHSDAILNTHNKSKIIHNGIAVASWASHLQHQGDYILAIGRLEPEKGFDLILDVYSNLYQKGVRTSLVIAGNGSIESQLQAKALAVKKLDLTEYMIS